MVALPLTRYVQEKKPDPEELEKSVEPEPEELLAETDGSSPQTDSGARPQSFDRWWHNPDYWP
ncbi:MAG: hypothetical protein NVS2B15_23160 [Pseudarthrobacter sp.]